MCALLLFSPMASLPLPLSPPANPNTPLLHEPTKLRPSSQIHRSDFPPAFVFGTATSAYQVPFFFFVFIYNSTSYLVLWFLHSHPVCLFFFSFLLGLFFWFIQFSFSFGLFFVFIPILSVYFLFIYNFILICSSAIFIPILFLSFGLFFWFISILFLRIFSIVFFWSS